MTATAPVEAPQDLAAALQASLLALRHRSLNSSLIYAKLDTPKLAAVALPWPGSAE